MNPRNTICVSLLVFFLTIAYTGVSLVHAYVGSGPISNGMVLGASTDSSITTGENQIVLAQYPTALSTTPPAIAAKEYELYNPDSGKTLVASSQMPEVPIASTTKLMTAYLAIKYGDMSDTITVSQQAGTMTGSLMGIYPGEQLTVKTLLYGALMVSGNDAATALGEYVGGILLKNPTATPAEEVTREVQEMNTTAQYFDMQNTHYMDPVGLNDNGHSTALDLAKLFAVDLKQPLLVQIFGTAETTVTDQKGKSFDLRNSDHITSDFNYPGNIGGKTGNTDLAGHCLVSAAERGGITLIGVVLDTNSNGILASANEDKKLLDYGFSNFTWN